MKMAKKALIGAMLLVMALCLVTGCGDKGASSSGPITNLSEPVKSTNTGTSQEELTEEELEAKENFANSTPENDTDIGLKNIKIDTAEATLTDAQKSVLNYFDNDYMDVPSFEFLQRYPQVYMGTNLHLDGEVFKLVSMDGENFEIILWVIDNSIQYYAKEYALDTAWYYAEECPWEYEEYRNENANALVCIKGRIGDAWFIEGDHIEVYGRYTEMSTKEIDGKSYIMPTIEASSAYIWDEWEYAGAERFTLKNIETVAEAIFGNDIEVREPVWGEDYEEAEYSPLDEDPFYIIELENQSNAKFTKYRIYTKRGAIEDAKTGDAWYLLGTNPNINRTIEFSADFEHYFVFSFDHSLEKLSLEYYDTGLKKIWEREFEETTSALYDYTKNNIYLCANNELYIINIETGEDTFSPAFIGAKQAIRKLTDGILTVGESKSDALIKNDLNGNMLWKTNLSGDVISVEAIQLVEDTIVLQLVLDYETHFVVVDNATGAILSDAVSITS